MDVTLATDQIGQMLARAQAGDQAVLPQLRQFLAENPELWQLAGDLAAHAREALLALAAGDNLLARESMRLRMDEMEAELAGPSPTALERVLARRVALCWAQAHLADLDTLRNDRGATPLAAHALRRQGAAQRRLCQAICGLVTARKLLPSASGTPALRVVREEGGA